MEDNLKVSYEQIKKANDEIKTTDIKGSNYSPVNERINAYRKVYPTGAIRTYLEELKEDYVRFRVEITSTSVPQTFKLPSINSSMKTMCFSIVPRR